MIVLVEPGSGVAGQGRRIGLAEGEEHHLRVRRAKRGELVSVRDGAGLVAFGMLVGNGKEWEVEITSHERRAQPAELVLAVGAGDRDRFTWLVEKAVEVGVSRVIPLETSRTGGVATRVRPQHVAKLRRHALEALKQCAAAWVCTVDDPMGMADFLAGPSTGEKWLASSEGEPPPSELGSTPVTVLIGPEGGLQDGEITAVLAAGFEPTALGRHTLRFETAAIAAAVAVGTARLRGNHG
jgi:16S rRNA (uracil1498-N3)-methyltransferase